MKIQQADLGKVLLSVINDLQLRAGGVVTLQVLTNAWAKVGLRRSDLDVATQQLVELGHLDAEYADDQAQCFTLTQTGYDKAVASASVLSLMASSASRLRRGAQRRRKQAGAQTTEPVAPNRRRKD